MGVPHTKESILKKKVIQQPNGCWEWKGSFYQNGYGAVSYQNKPCKAHRLTYILFNGPIAEGLQVCHKCDNKKCVNPSHLFLGTHQDNMDDCVNKGRRPRGEKTGRASLNAERARFIVANKEKIIADFEYRKKLALEFGVGQETIFLVAKRLSWKHITI